jgi:hypothetical protein
VVPEWRRFEGSGTTNKEVCTRLAVENICPFSVQKLETIVRDRNGITMMKKIMTIREYADR